MYRKQPEGWIKHFDFMLIDLICICLIVVLFVIHMGGRFSRLVLVYFSGIATGFLYLSRCGWKIFVRKRTGVISAELK